MTDLLTRTNRALQARETFQYSKPGKRNNLQVLTRGEEHNMLLAMT